ncbi:MAG: hypothetical protein ABI939_08540 [Anaerolineaceae bacterium]
MLAAGLAFLPFTIAGSLGHGLVIGLVVALGTLLLMGAIASWLYGTRSARKPPG